MNVLVISSGVTAFLIAGGILAALYAVYYLVFNIDWKQAPEEEEEEAPRFNLPEQMQQRSKHPMESHLDQMMNQMMEQAEEQRREEHRGEKILLEISISENNEMKSKKDGTMFGMTALAVKAHFADGTSAMREFSELSSQEREQMILKELENMEAYEVLAMFRDAKEGGDIRGFTQHL